MLPVIAAVVVTHSVPPEMLEACVDALTGAGGLDLVTIVDTGRGTATVEPVEVDRRDVGAPGQPRCIVERLVVVNHGYGAAADTGMRRALERGARAIAVLNDDVIVTPGWLEPLVAALAEPGVGAVQPVLLGLAGAGQVISSAGVGIGADGAGVDLASGSPYDAGAPASDLAIFTGGAVVLDAEFVQATGGFDERWFLYYEDVDLALRGRRLGWRYRLVPASAVVHHGGVSTGRDTGRTRFLQERNRIWAAIRFAPLATIARALWLSVRRLRHEPRGVHARALAAGVLGSPRWALRRATRRVRTGSVSAPRPDR